MDVVVSMTTVQEVSRRAQYLSYLRAAPLLLSAGKNLTVQFINCGVFEILGSVPGIITTSTFVAHVKPQRFRQSHLFQQNPKCLSLDLHVGVILRYAFHGTSRNCRPLLSLKFPDMQHLFVFHRTDVLPLQCC
jgi:hypothetical protein